jgi:hypothetical protein
MFSDTKWRCVNIISGFVILKNWIVIDSVVAGFLEIL